MGYGVAFLKIIGVRHCDKVIVKSASMQLSKLLHS